MILFYICYKSKTKTPCIIGKKLKSLRIEKGFEPHDMALKLAISETTYRRYERNETIPDINMLEKIAIALGKSFLDLLPDSIVFTNNDQKGGIAVTTYQSTINQQNDKLIEQCEKRISEIGERLKEKDERLKEKNEIIADLKARLKKYEG